MSAPTTPPHLLVYDGSLDIRIGGPCGYLANLREGFRRSITPDGEIVGFECDPDHPVPMAELMQRVPSQAEFETQIRSCEEPRTLGFSPDREKRVLDALPRSIHTHLFTDFHKVYNLRARAGIENQLLLYTCHAPEAAAKETADWWGAKGFDSALVDTLSSHVSRLEISAYQLSDIWIFPSPEAMEPAANVIPNFEALRLTKDVRFVHTGCIKPPPLHSRADARDVFECGKKIVFCFMGRHIDIKGYDIFCEAGTKLLEACPDTMILVAGSKGTSTPPDHPRWKEIGWLQTPSDLLLAADALVAPNRSTFYDLAVIEALSMGATILASATGGNKTISAQTEGAVELFNPTSEGAYQAMTKFVLRQRKMRGLPAILRNLVRHPDDPRILNSVWHKRLFTAESFAARYCELIKKIHADYGEQDGTLARGR